MIANEAELGSWPSTAVISLSWRWVNSSVCVPRSHVLTWVVGSNLLLLVLLLVLLDRALVVQEVIHLCVLVIHLVLPGAALSHVVSHLALHDWLILELLQAEVLLIGSSHIVVWLSLNAWVPRRVILLDGDLAHSLLLLRPSVLRLSALATLLHQFTSLGIILESIEIYNQSYKILTLKNCWCRSLCSYQRPDVRFYGPKLMVSWTESSCLLEHHYLGYHEYLGATFGFNH